MITGENRLYAHDADNPADHLAVTVEMVSPEHRREICVIDEIQMLRDPLRGAAWTRALLGAPTDEVCFFNDNLFKIFYFKGTSLW